MKVKFLKNEQIGDFISYCKKHRLEIDESFLYDEDLKNFKPNHENPTYIGINQQGDIVATASLIIDDYFRRGRKARFRIFHSEIEDSTCYTMLMEAIMKHTKGLDKVFLFIPLENKQLIGFMEALNFTVERYSYFFSKRGIQCTRL